MSFLKTAAYSLVSIFVFVSPAFAAAEAGTGSISNSAIIALAIGLAAFGGAMGQGKVASTALDGISRNPGASGQMTTPLIMGLALIESLVLLTWLMIFLLK